MNPFRALLPLHFAGALGCWSGGLTPELCCYPPPVGNPDCWDGDYTFDRCCRSTKDIKVSDGVQSHKIESTMVPLLPMLDGGSIPQAGLGLCCRQTAVGEAARQAVVDFLMMGGRHLDDAMLYSNHREVGQGVRDAMTLGIPREEIFFVTKIWHSDFGFEKTTNWVHEMLEQVGLPYVDLVLLHSPQADERLPCGVPKACRQETWLALQRAQRKGQIRHLGVSNFGPRQLQELFDLGGSLPVVNQIEFHPWVPEVHRQTAEWCKAKGIVVTAYGSMGSNRLAAQLMEQNSLREVGARYGKTVGQVLLRWAIQKGIAVIPGTSNPNHMAENLRIFDFELSAEEMALLDSVPEDARMHFFGHTPDSTP